MEKWMNGWSYFLQFSGETMETTKKVCHVLIHETGKSFPNGSEKSQQIRVCANEIAKHSYVMLCDEQEEPKLIFLCLASEESKENEADFRMNESSEKVLDLTIKFVSDVTQHVPTEQIAGFIEKGRDFMKAKMLHEYASDQMLKKTQPPLVKAAQHELIFLSKDFSKLPIENDFLKIVNQRKSHRVYANEPLSIDEVSYLLWCTQGVKTTIKNNYATIRTVPCGGARHEFETYLSIHHVTGLKQGVYHYLPMEHALELLHEQENIEATCSYLLCDQTFAGKSALTFMWSCVCYRAEWRYSIDAHRIILQDIGHVGENLYLACESIGLGTCGVGAYLQVDIDEYCELDGNEEFIVYTAPVGKALNGEEA